MEDEEWKCLKLATGAVPVSYVVLHMMSASKQKEST